MSMKNKNKILIYGGGGIGSYFAGAFSKNGKDVTLLTRGNHLENIKNYGLKLETNWGSYVQNLNLVTNINDNYELTILAVKTYSVKSILNDLKNLREGSKVLCIQNGTFTYNFLSTELSKTGIEVIDGLTWIDAIRREEGGVVQTGNEAKIIFGKNNLSKSKKIEYSDLALSLNSENVQVEYSENIGKAVWEKLIMVAAIGSIMCYSNMNAKKTVENVKYLNILKEMIIEMVNASKSIGIDIDEDYSVNTLNYILGRAEDLHSSLKEDFDHKRPLEVDEILGEALRTGVKNNVDMPNCQVVYDELIKFARI